MCGKTVRKALIKYVSNNKTCTKDTCIGLLLKSSHNACE